jgi:mRNA interferase RelE/StbE
MSSYTVTLRPAAQRALKRLDKPVQKRIAEALRSLANEPRPPGVKALTGASELLRIRVGDYRIIYSVDDDELEVLVIVIGHRSAVYRNI